MVLSSEASNHKYIVVFFCLKGLIKLLKPVFIQQTEGNLAFNPQLAL